MALTGEACWSVVMMSAMWPTKYSYQCISLNEVVRCSLKWLACCKKGIISISMLCKGCYWLWFYCIRLPAFVVDFISKVWETVWDCKCITSCMNKHLFASCISFSLYDELMSWTLLRTTVIHNFSPPLSSMKEVCPLLRSSSLKCLMRITASRTWYWMVVCQQSSFSACPPLSLSISLSFLSHCLIRIWYV